MVGIETEIDQLVASKPPHGRDNKRTSVFNVPLSAVERALGANDLQLAWAKDPARIVITSNEGYTTKPFLFWRKPVYHPSIREVFIEADYEELIHEERGVMRSGLRWRGSEEPQELGNWAQGGSKAEAQRINRIALIQRLLQNSIEAVGNPLYSHQFSQAH